MRLGQLQTLHSDWFNGSVYLQDRSTLQDHVTRHQVRVSSNEHNLHIVLNSPLVFAPAEVVMIEALAMADHDSEDARPALFLPPAEGMGVQVIAAPSSSSDPLKAIALPPLLAGSLSYQPADAQYEVEQLPIARASNPLSQNQLEHIDLKIYEFTHPVRPTLEEKRAKAPMAKAYAPAPPALELLTRARRQLEGQEAELIQMIGDPAVTMLRGRLHIALDQVADISQRRSDALSWLETQTATGLDHQGIPAVRQGVRKLDDELAAEASKIVWLEAAIADHNPPGRGQPSASSGSQLLGPDSQQKAPGEMAMSGSFLIEEVP